MLERISETLAGRSVYVTLWPFSRRELRGLGDTGPWSDTGLAMFLAGESKPRGAHLENLVLTDLLVWRDLQARRPEVLYWRTATGLEVDFVIETPRRLLPVEVKAGERVTSADARGLTAFVEEYPGLADGGLLLYGGREVFPLTRRVLAVPWWQVC